MEKKDFMEPFAGDSISMAMSNVGQKKLSVKIAHETRGIKKLREKPNTHQELIKIVGAHAKDGDLFTTYQVQYTDECGDVIAVSDDEDLAAAYEWAETQPAMNLKFNVKARETKVTKDEKEMQDTTAHTTIQGKSEPQESSDSSDEAEDKPLVGGMTHTAIGVPKLADGSVDSKKMRKHQKAIKKMVKKSMQEHSRELIKSIMEEETVKVEDISIKVGAGASDQIDTEAATEASARVYPELEDKEDLRQSVHLGVACDGCGVAPILGARYKCTVRKNFDYCAACEATKDHPHAFLKINDPAQAPRAMFTVMNEDEPQATEAGQPPRGFPFGGRGGPWRRGHCRGGRGGHGGFGRHHQGQTPEGNYDPDEFAKKMENWGKCMGEWGKKVAEEHKQGGQNGCEGMDPQTMKKKVGWFMRNMFGGGRCHGGPPQGCGPRNQAPEARKNPDRAIPVKFPTDQFAACAGDMIEVEVTFENAVPFPYKDGFHVENIPGHMIFTEPIKVPLGEIPGKSKYTVKIPVKISEAAESCIRTGASHYDLELGVTNKHGAPVGQTCTLKFRVIEKIDEMALYDKVMQLEAFTKSASISESQAIPFEESVAALKQADYDVNKAVEFVMKKKNAGASQFDMIDDDGDNLYD